MKEAIWTTVFLILSAIAGFTIGEIIDDPTDKSFVGQLLERDKKCNEPGNVITDSVCSPVILLYDCQGNKAICECIGTDCPCVKTEEILSEMG